MLDAEGQALKDILLTDGICTSEQIQDSEEEHDRTGKSFREVIINYGFLTEQEILQHFADNLGTEIFDFKQADIKHEVIQMIDPEIARAYGVIPVSMEDNNLKVVAKNPMNYQVIEELQFILGLEIQVLVAEQDTIDTAVEKYYPVTVASVHDVLSEMSGDEEDEQIYDNVTDLENAANDAPIVRFVEVILYQAIKDQASDIHFEPFETSFRIRYRVDGTLYEMPPPSKSLAVPVISRVKIMSGLNIAERRLPQDGRIQLKIGGKPIDLRVATLPTSYGESVVLRILDRSVVNLDLNALGISTDVLAQLRDIIHMPNGILLVTGPTGSGKTTTLYSALQEVNEIGEKLLTAEDPVEYDIEGIIQLPVNNAYGMTFQKALRAFLRQDPDRIMIGEIRDLETAQTAIESALTGHFVFSTLHTNDAAGTVTRLVDMGVEPFLLCSSIAGIVSQRLIRRVCKNCRVPYEPKDEELEKLNLVRDDIGDRKFYYGKGCQNCNESGYRGRKSICELLTMSPELMELILKNAPTVAIREKAREQGMVTIREDGVQTIVNGETTVDEVLRYT
ncbi:MAG: Flp pilus assembly complex ATPase component TadA [Victivallales bacterium]|nr:Flp pilus assembly complex ATPase component TadA [Victivallales bacterium]